MIFAVNFFQSIIEYFLSVWRALLTFAEYLKTIVLNLFMGVTYLLTAQQTITAILGFIPYAIGGACTAFIAIAILRFFCLK